MKNVYVKGESVMVDAIIDCVEDLKSLQTPVNINEIVEKIKREARRQVDANITNAVDSFINSAWY